MFSKNKEENKIEELIAGREKDITKDVEIHVMPSKFISAENENKINKKILSMIFVAAILLLVVSGVIIFAYKDKFFGIDNSANKFLPKEAISPPSWEDKAEIAHPAVIATTTKQIIATSASETKTATATSEIIATTTPEVIATTTPEIIATTTPEVIATTTQEMLDSDKDGLSDKEEDLFGTDKLSSDTDNDGYLDGNEIINLYDPLTKAPHRLTGSKTINKYSENRYGMLFPEGFISKVEEEGKILFKSPDGEFFELLISPNLDGISITDWYKIQTGENVNLNEVEEIINKERLSGMKISQSAIYLNDYNYIYIITYNPFDQPNYSAAFEMMWQSFTSKIDTDGDGIADYKEIDIYRTDPKKVDTDDDGYNDGEEIGKGYDPLK